MNRTEKNILNKIKEAKRIIIFRHRVPDGDAYGSQFGLGEILKNNFKNKEIILAAEEEKNIKNLSTIFPFKQLKTNYKISKTDLLIVLDCPTVERISGKFEHNDNVVIIDHHPKMKHFANIDFIDTSFSSTCEMITEFAHNNGLSINTKAATYLYTGIITDTNRFYFNSTTSNTLLWASILKENKIDTDFIYKQIYSDSLNTIKFKAFLVNNMKIKGHVAYIMVEERDYKKFKVEFEEASSQVNALLGAKEINYALYAIYKKVSKDYKVSLRSKKLPINKIAEQFNGGGHAMASGAKVKDTREFNLLLKQLIKLDEKS